MYVIFFFTGLFSFPPIPSADNADNAASIGKPNGENARSNLAKTILPLLFLTMGQVFGDNTLWVSEGVLRIFKRDAMLLQVFSILVLIPLEPVTHFSLTASYSVKRERIPTKRAA